MPRPWTNPLCAGCGVTVNPRARKVAVCPRCLAALQEANEGPPDCSDVEKSYIYEGDPYQDAVPWYLIQLEFRCAVSAVVPLFRSEKYVRQCLESLLRCLPSGSEIIAVDDGSPDRSGEIAERVLRDSERGLVVRLSRNTGFAHAVNAGAECATGEHLLLFNADAVARPGFVRPMLHLMDRYALIAVVGNRHVKPDGSGDSEGSEWSWKTKTFRHIGREIPDPVTTAAPPVAPFIRRDMVTFACALVRRSIWEEMGGLDEGYRLAYHEDADFCMRVRDSGCWIAYTPDVQGTITHVGGHSGAGHHAWWEANQRLFTRRWADTGMVDKFRRERGLRAHAGRIIVCMIACSEEEFVAAAIESVIPLADRIVIVEGGTRYALEAGLCDAEGRSTDRTLQEIAPLAREWGHIVSIGPPGRPWRDKHEMRERYVHHLRPGDWMVQLDADEVFTKEGLWRLSALMNGAAGEADVISPTFFPFWNDLDTLGTGKWDDYRQAKAVRWREGWDYRRSHNCPSDAQGRYVTRLPDVRILKPPPHERLFCHYSWAGKSVEKLRAKARYFIAQNAAEGHEPFPADYIDRVFLPWRTGDEERRRLIEKRYGTHPYGGGGTRRFEGEHPEAVQERILTAENAETAENGGG